MLPVILLAALFLTPFVIVLRQAVSGWRADEAPLHLGNFLRALDVDHQGTHFPNLLGNSVLFSGVSAALGVLFASAAYVLARFRFLGRDLLFFVVVGTMMFPWQVTLIPNFVLARDLHWLNTYASLIAPALPKAFAEFLLRQQMLAVPGEMLGAARLDGAGEWRLWWSVLMPVVRPALLAVFKLLALSEWSSFLWPYLVADDGINPTLPVALSRIRGEGGAYPAVLVLTMLPLVLVFLGFQRTLGQGLSIGRS